ncbi:eIF-2-alpha kinase activator GCN1-like, partial [Paramuricea clavata]
AIQHSSLEIRVLACDAIYYISQNTQDISTLFLKMTTSELLPLTKEKNTSIKFAAEVSLVSLMKSGKDQNRYQTCLTSLDTSSASVLSEFHKKSIPRILERNETVACELDNPFPTGL